ncbi:MAG: zinc ribbon domain-containing protein [Chloroflexota bacterium]
MPLYDYDCAACGRRIEVVHGVHAPGPAHCPSCGAGPLRKAITAAAVHFKGSGWAKKERRASVAPGGGTSAGEAAAAEADAKDAGATTSAPRSETGASGSEPAVAASTANGAGTTTRPADPATKTAQTATRPD